MVPRTFTRQFRSSFPKYRYAAIAVNDFSGGLNLISAPSQLADNESADMLNVTLDERGGVVKRLGFSRVNSSALDSTPQQLFWWDEKAIMVYQCGAKVYTTANDFTSVTLRKTYTTSNRAAFTAFNGKLIAIHPDDGLASYDGASTWTDIAAGPKGSSLAVWQNKVWTNDAVNPVRVRFSAAGDATTWADFVDIREGSDAPVTALGAGQGMDTSGRPGLLVFKAGTIHRINNSTTGAYTTLFTDGGATNHNAVISALGVTAAMSERGIIVLDEQDSPTLVSTKIDKLFKSSQINFSKSNLFATGALRDRIYFSFPFGSSQTTNNRTLEFIPASSAFVIHDLAASAFARFHSGTEKLYGASPTDSYVRWMFHTGADHTSAISAYYQTKWYEPLTQGTARFRQCQLEGRGTYTLFVKRDYETGQGVAFPIDLSSTGSKWNTFVWNTDTWGPDIYENFDRIFSLGVGRSIAFKIQESSTTSATSPSLVGSGAADETGAFALYAFRLDFIPLGLS